MKYVRVDLITGRRAPWKMGRISIFGVERSM